MMLLCAHLVAEKPEPVRVPRQPRLQPFRPGPAPPGRPLSDGEGLEHLEPEVIAWCASLGSREGVAFRTFLFSVLGSGPEPPVGQEVASQVIHDDSE